MMLSGGNDGCLQEVESKDEKREKEEMEDEGGPSRVRSGWPGKNNRMVHFFSLPFLGKLQ